MNPETAHSRDDAFGDRTRETRMQSGVRAEHSDMSKRELIDRIMKINRSARREFLQAFSENELADYLRQLEAVQPVTMTYQARRSDR